MNRDDIISMAREAGIPLDPKHPGWLLPHLERFAKLVAAAEREACTRVCEEMHAEHEMCARVNEEVRNDALWEFRS